MSFPLRISKSLLAAICLVAVLTGAAPAADPCLECHGEIGFGVDGRPQWLHAEALAVSIHSNLTCNDCHKGAETFPHGDDLRLRCDLRCHVAQTSHAAVAKAVAGSVHSAIAAPPCAACHDGTAAPPRATRAQRCTGCHPNLEPERVLYPDSPGAFGFHAHRSVPATRRAPDCVDCHGAHSVASGAAARASCTAPACHPKEGEAFGILFDHRAQVERQPWGGAGTTVLAILALFGALLTVHSVRG